MFSPVNLSLSLVERCLLFLEIECICLLLIAVIVQRQIRTPILCFFIQIPLQIIGIDRFILTKTAFLHYLMIIGLVGSFGAFIFFQNFSLCILFYVKVTHQFYIALSKIFFDDRRFATYYSAHIGTETLNGTFCKFSTYWPPKLWVYSQNESFLLEI